jgi:glucosamine kinase
VTAFVIGVDGGGTRTRVIVADEGGHQLATAEGPGSAIHPGETARSADIIAQTIGAALDQISPDRARARCLCVGVAGVGRGEARESLLDELDARNLAGETLVMADAMIALEDAFDDGAGILLIAGTGSIAVGRGPTGEVARSGGWGFVCGDEGSGAWLGQRALGVVTAAHDGREPETGLTNPLLQAAGVDGIDALVPWASRATPADLARLAPAVLEVAATGDLRSSSLVALAVEELGLHVLALSRRLFADERATFSLALSGGLLARGALLRRRLEQRLKSLTPGAQLRVDEVIGVRGAVKVALRHTLVARTS